MSRTTSLTRILGAAALALAAVGVTGGPASAKSQPIPYTCDFTVADVQGTGDATATWDSAVPDDGISVPPWTPVPLDPYTGSVALPDAFVDALRTDGVTELGGIGTHQVDWDWTDAPQLIELAFPTTPVPATGPMTLALTGIDAGTFSHSDAETFVLTARGFSLGTEDGTIGMSCAFTDYRASTRVIDRVTVTLGTTTPPAPTTTATAGPTATSSPSATTSAVRPALVQTDQPQSGGAVSPLVVLGVVAVVVAGGAAAAWIRRSRRR